MKLAVRSPNQAAKDFQEQRSSLILSNTFLNFQEEETRSTSWKRSRSAGAAPRSGVSAPDGMKPFGTPSLSQHEDPLADAPSGSMAGPCASAKQFETDPASTSSLAELMSKLSVTCNSPAASLPSPTTTEAASNVAADTLAVSKLGWAPPPARTVAALGESAAAQAFTTLHLMNLPRRFTCSDLRLELDASGFQGTYDFVHVPVTFSCGISTGYAFVNFRSPHVAARLLAEWQGSRRLCTRQWRHRKAMEVQAASMQGLCRYQTETMRRKMQRIKNPSYKPWFAVSF